MSARRENLASRGPVLFLRRRGFRRLLDGERPTASVHGAADRTPSAAIHMRTSAGQLCANARYITCRTSIGERFVRGLSLLSVQLAPCMGLGINMGSRNHRTRAPSRTLTNYWCTFGPGKSTAHSVVGYVCVYASSKAQNRIEYESLERPWASSGRYL